MEMRWTVLRAVTSVVVLVAAVACAIVGIATALLRPRRAYHQL
jgi:hypothetical protein